MLWWKADEKNRIGRKAGAALNAGGARVVISAVSVWEVAIKRQLGKLEAPPDLPYTLPIGDTVTLKCLWNWVNNRQETIAIMVKTAEGYLGYLQHTIP